MSDTVLQLAKRELRGLLASRPIWLACVAAGLLLGLTGPFGTDGSMRLVPRTLYWVVVACLTYGSGAVLSAVLRARLKGRPAWLVIALAAVLTGLVVLGEVTVLNALVLGWVPDRTEVLVLGAEIMAISVVIHTAGWVIARDIGASSGTDPARPRLLDRLPLEKRGTLVSLSAVDHYVEVTTTKGTELLLMRLTDAIAEAHPVEGVQIHRSHWVASDHVRAVTRDGGRTQVRLGDDRMLPVSRANVASLREAGLLAD